MDVLRYLTTVLFAIWCISESALVLFSIRNRSRGWSEARDRFSSVLIWISIMPAVCFAMLVWLHVLFRNGFGSFSTASSLLGYLGCLVMIVGMTIRLMAVATLKKHFTTMVSIVENHEIVDAGIYRIVRHPAYLGLLTSLLGIGLTSGNWFSLAVLVVLPLAGLLYRIRVEEKALLGHFGPAYQKYASQTKRLLPGIW